jgi:preprotein translocase subunit SecF
MRLFAGANYKFLEMRRAAYVLSALAILIGVLSITVHKGLNYGVDFTGGTLMQIRFQSPVTASEVRSALSDAGVTNFQVQGFGGSNEFLARMAEFTERGQAQVSARIRQALNGRFGEGAYTIVRTEAVGPKVGGELRQKAAWAVLISFMLTLVYLGFRFEWRFGLAAIIATFHDILITFGIISVLGIEISLPTVAAILTIIGYSLNDTIVIFDRIRENLKKLRRESYIDILDRSINETLPRTIMTSGTTLAVLVALGIFGGAVIRPFAIILIAGIAVGTFSSIFVASPALLEIERYTRRRRGTESRGRAVASPR